MDRHRGFRRTGYAHGHNQILPAEYVVLQGYSDTLNRSPVHFQFTAQAVTLPRPWGMFAAVATFLDQPTFV